MSLFDNMIIQPFGMMEDFGLIVLGIARTRPKLALRSWICFLVVMNVVQAAFLKGDSKICKMLTASIFLACAWSCAGSVHSDQGASIVHLAVLGASMVFLSVASSGLGSIIARCCSPFFSTRSAPLQE